MRDYYGDAQIVADQLATLGLVEWKERIENAVLAGSTSGEILMALRWQLKELLKIERSLPANLRQQAKDLIRAINASGA